MDFRLLARPASQLLQSARQSTSSTSTTVAATASLQPLISTRGHKTTARTKRSLKIAPHHDFQPDRSVAFPTADSIIYNPPSSEASPAHTPFLFLPPSDPRRFAIERMRLTNNVLDGNSLLSAIPGSTETSQLPPEMKYRRREDQPKYHLSAKDVNEMRRLRTEDPLKWSVNALARQFKCSEVFVKIAAPASAEHLSWLAAKKERQQARWGPMKTEARKQRKQRTEMLYRGEL